MAEQSFPTLEYLGSNAVLNKQLFTVQCRKDENKVEPLNAQ